MNPTYDFHGLVALVTGASSGIGFAAAQAFAESRASVVLADIDEQRVSAAADKLSAAGFDVIGVKCDVADERQVAALIERVITKFGRLDMAFNNAGIPGPSGNFTDETGDDFDKVNAVNLRGIWTCMKHELLHMQKQGSGAIVNCSSLGGLVGQSGRAAYHATKHGVIGLTKSVALEYAPSGIRVNAICPGVVETPMFAALGEVSAEAMKQVVLDQPIGRLGRPEEIAASVLWLCSAAASFVVGAALPVDGGFTAR
ncbi:glucose 1-dehydrogenase [Rhizobium sp. BK060]|uniref:glucose 1-dehydrogenase n=1 Tax=Rhizobium sp. BK060 TaxID=2587096 RepID=UPI001613D4ED|nr:glucose 1-dehydrogenase [Rhizobium sp. BK060]MBB3398796.1 NAD(P)-dependent dehydrogenase (short-subunit alcohol dehydrogenase family) [Rhizobium sp. BK060]